MNPELVLKHEFVQFIPDRLDDRTIYVSITYATVVHKCCCGCGNEVVTPLSPADWELIFDGQSISLNPSIGNWSFPCQSHYWIKRNKVQWAPRWSQESVARARDRLAKTGKFESVETRNVHGPFTDDGSQEKEESKASLWQKVKKWLSQKR